MPTPASGPSGSNGRATLTAAAAVVAVVAVAAWNLGMPKFPFGARDDEPNAGVKDKAPPAAPPKAKQVVEGTRIEQIGVALMLIKDVPLEPKMEIRVATLNYATSLLAQAEKLPVVSTQGESGQAESKTFIAQSRMLAYGLLYQDTKLPADLDQAISSGRKALDPQPRTDADTELLVTNRGRLLIELGTLLAKRASIGMGDAAGKDLNDADDVLTQAYADPSLDAKDKQLARQQLFDTLIKLAHRAPDKDAATKILKRAEGLLDEDK